MNPNRRALVIGGIIAALLVAGLVVGIVVLRGPNDTVGPNDESPTPTDVHAEVEQAYLKFWNVWAEVNESLDPSRLSEVMTGEALELAQGLIEEQRAKNEPLRVQVEHNYRIVITDEATASVDDTFLDRTTRLDPETREPTGAPANQTIRNSYTMKEESGIWKVAAIIQYRSPSP